MQSSLDDLLFFVTLVEAGSLTKAAEKLNIPKSKVSRRLVQLENTIGSTLLIRTTRSQKLTESGELLFQASKPHIDALNNVEEQIGHLVNEPVGQLNILLPLEFFNQVMSGLVAEFALMYPKIRLNCAHYSDVFPVEHHNYDITFVLHESPLPESNWIAKTLLSFPQAIYASKDYDIAHIREPEDLVDESCILAHQQEQWLFRDGNSLQAVPVHARVVFTSPEMRRQCTERNLGITKLPNYTCQLNCKMQKLQLTKQPVAQQLSVLYQSRDVPLKTRVFLDFFQNNVGRLEL
ncbi:LysR family transcriptional regulator [Saccharobesus litoralis]|uniref:LysR family transcriptional regulator n=1 Tax=Saccharobesus litoralis TaxID=2172099 RepID=A0A2S0VVD4_9ALTE|nr:LysR family transcriptional regulator [Saccharobesus litoralis]AWB68155.1 LysR family transcriptional regulator [Saccharobesus litoralis]